MSNQNKYEALIEHIINDNEQAARELFHQIVVEKSRDIYESLMDEEQLGGNQSQEFVRDITMQDQAADQQGLGEADDDMDLDLDDEEPMGMGDAEEPMGMDDAEDMPPEETFGDEAEMGAEGGDHAEIEDALSQIKDMIGNIEAKLSGDEAPADDMGDVPSDDVPSEFDMDDEAGNEESDEEDISDEADGESEEPVQEAKSGNPFAKSGSGKSGSGKSGSGKSGSGMKESYKKSDVEIMKEYVDKIGEIYKQEPAQGEGKTVGTGGDAPTVNKSSIMRKQEAVFDGETAKNIANGGAEQSPDGKSIPKPKNEYSKGETKFSNEQFKNAPGNKKVWDKKEPAGHGAEKKSGAEGKLTGNDGTVPVNTKGPITSKVR